METMKRGNFPGKWKKSGLDVSIQTQMVTFDFEPVFDLFGIFIGNIWLVQHKNPNKRVIIEKIWNLEKPRNQPQNSQKPKSPKAQKSLKKLETIGKYFE